MMYFFRAFSACVFLVFTAQGQLLDNREGNAFTDVPFFNRAFVKASKLKQIKGKYTFKKQGDIMRKSDYVYIFEFDEQGNLREHFETAKGDIVSDSIVKFYDYDSSNRLVRMRISQKKGFLTTIYVHDTLGRVIREETYRDIDTTHSMLHPQIERSLLWNTETFTYDNYNGQDKKIAYNSYGNPYLETSRLYDSLGYLKQISELYTITRNQLNTYYTYSDKGWIASMRTFANQDSIPRHEDYFTYDEYGNMQSKKVYFNGVFTTEYQLIYSQTTGLLHSILIREVSSNFISIIQFQPPAFWN